jgi:hypothetical protein
VAPSDGGREPGDETVPDCPAQKGGSRSSRRPVAFSPAQPTDESSTLSADQSGSHPIAGGPGQANPARLLGHQVAPLREIDVPPATDSTRPEIPTAKQEMRAILRRRWLLMTASVSVIVLSFLLFSMLYRARSTEQHSLPTPAVRIIEDEVSPHGRAESVRPPRPAESVSIPASPAPEHREGSASVFAGAHAHGHADAAPAPLETRPGDARASGRPSSHAGDGSDIFRSNPF